MIISSSPSPHIHIPAFIWPTVWNPKVSHFYWFHFNTFISDLNDLMFNSSSDYTGFITLMTTGRCGKRVATTVASSVIPLYPKKKTLNPCFESPPPSSLYLSSSAGRRVGGNWDSMCSSASLIRWWRKKHWMIHMCFPSLRVKLLTLKLTGLWIFVFADILVACDWSRLAAGTACSYVMSCIKRICLSIICQKEETLGDVFFKRLPSSFPWLGQQETWQEWALTSGW